MHKNPNERQAKQKDVEEGEERRALCKLTWCSKGFGPHGTSLMVLCRGDAELETNSTSSFCGRYRACGPWSTPQGSLSERVQTCIFNECLHWLVLSVAG